MEKAITIENLQAALTQTKNKIDTKYGDLPNQISDLDTIVTSLSLQTAIGGKLDYGCFMMSSSPVAYVDFILPFDTVKESLNMPILNGFVGIEKGKTYEINAILYSYNISSFTAYAIFETDTNTQISNLGYSYSANYNGTGGSVPAKCIFTAKNDCSIYVKITSATTQSIYGPASILTIQEIGRSTIVDPLNAKENHMIEYGKFTLSEHQSTGLTINEKVKFNTTVSGNIYLDPSAYSVSLKKGKTYNIEFGIMIVGSTTASVQFQIYDNEKNIYVDNSSYVIANTFTRANNSSLPTVSCYYTPDVDCSISIRIGGIYDVFTSINKLSYLTVQEVAHPIITEYNTYNEISNPLMKDQMQDSPVGTMMTYSGLNAPTNYLLMDGAVYNISDYKELAEHFLNELGSYNFFGGDGITTFGIPNKFIQNNTIVPILTSNIAPAPFVVTSSSSYNDSYSGYKAFNGTTIDAYDAWLTASGVLTGWLAIDLGKAYNIETISLTCRNGQPTTAPKDFTIEGSNDGSNFTVLKTITGETTWVTNTKITYDLNNTSNYYRYYKINITANNGSSTYLSIGDILLFAKETELPCIKAKPTYTPINQYGGFESEVLFDGNANALGNYNLNGNIDDYDFLIVRISRRKASINTKVSPIMTSNILPSPYVISASSEMNSSYLAFNLFNNNNTDNWYTSVPNITGWAQIDFSLPTKVDSFEIVGGNDASANPHNYNILGSNDGINFTIINSYSETIGASQVKSHTFTNSATFRYYRLEIISNEGRGNYSGFAELRFYNASDSVLLIEDKFIYVKQLNDKAYVSIQYTKDKSYSSYLEYQFSTNNTFNIRDLLNDSGLNDTKITKVIGYKGQLPTLFGGGDF